MNPSLFWAGNYYGSHFQPDHYEILTIQKVSRKEREGESALMDVKWYDYRLMHPMQATYYLVHLYRKAYRDFIRRSLDAARAPYSQGIKERDFLDSREHMALWRLRRTIDQLGMPYDFFLAFAMKWLHKMIGDGKVYPPRPAMLGKNQELMGDALAAWEDLCNSSMQIARSPSFRVSNFNHQASAHQRAHEAFIVAQLKKRHHPHFGLHAALYTYDVVSIETALQEFGAEVVQRAIEDVCFD